MKKSAETLKNEMRQMVEGLRGKFRKLLTENDQLPTDLRMPRQVTTQSIVSFIKKKFHFSLQDFILDENIRENFQKELQEKAELSTKELKWESERCNIALKKLEQW